MQVVGTGARPVGQVAELRGTDFRLSRPDGVDVYVPYEAIRAMLGGEVVLDVRADQIDAQGWPTSAAGT